MSSGAVRSGALLCASLLLLGAWTLSAPGAEGVEEASAPRPQEAFAPGSVGTAGPDRAPGPVRTTAVHSDGPLPGFTGGFGEPDCRTCHEGPSDAASAVLLLRGVPPAYGPGERYVLTVRLSRADLGAAGFQLSARWAEGPREGAHAGTLSALGARVAVDRTGDPPVEYARHTLEGSRVDGGGVAEWQVVWRAPEEPLGAVRFHLAANAADGDETEFGDRVELLEARASAERPPTSAGRVSRP